MSFDLGVGQFFTVPLKRSETVDLIKDSSTAVDSINDIKEVNTMRQQLINKPIEKTATGLQSLYDYRKTLSLAIKGLQTNPFVDSNPFETGFDIVGFEIPFTWHDSIEKGRFRSSKKHSTQLTVVGGEFEKLCVLYNIAALMTQISAESDLTTDDGLKLATKYFQEAAGIFCHLKAETKIVLGKSLVNICTKDFSSPCTLRSAR